MAGPFDPPFTAPAPVPGGSGGGAPSFSPAQPVTPLVVPNPTYYNPPTGVQPVSVPKGAAAVTPTGPYAYPNFMAKVLALKAGTAGVRPVLGVIGDSLTAAFYIKRQDSWVQQMRPLFEAMGVPTRDDAIWADANVGGGQSGYNTYNPDLLLDSTWGTTNYTTTGGNFFSDGNGATPFTPRFPADSFDLYFGQYAGGATLTVSDATGWSAVVSPNVDPGGLRKFSVKRPTNTTAPITIKHTSGQTGFLGAIVPWSTVTPRLELWNIGWTGSKTADWLDTSQGFSAGNALKVIAPDITLSLIDLGANDSANNVAVADYKARIQAIAALCQGAGKDVGLVKTHGGPPGGQDGYTVPATYYTGLDQVATSLALPAPIPFQTVALVQADYHDSIHLERSGYGKESPVAFGRVTAFA